MAIAAVGSPVDGTFANASSLTFSYTVIGGSDAVVLVAFAFQTGNDDVTSVTVGGTAASLIKKHTSPSGGSRNLYLYGAISPPTGAQNVVISITGSRLILGGASEYTGISSLTPDAETTTLSGSHPNHSTAVTTSADNCWTFSVLSIEGAVFSASTGATRRAYDTNFGTWHIFDSNAAITPAGSHTMNYTASGAVGKDALMVSLAPAGGGGGGGTVIPVLMNQYRQRWG